MSASNSAAHKDLVLGVDGGGSKTIALLADRHGGILGRGEAGPSNFQALEEGVVRPALGNAVKAAFADANLEPRPAAVIGLGLSGVDRPQDYVRVQTWVYEDRLAHKAVIGNDGSLLLWAGTPAGWGVGVISGTGSIVYGRTADGKQTRAGGWGYRFGDEGSGFAIGTAALRAVTKAADGRGPQTLLTAIILGHWGLQQPADLIPYVYKSNLPYPQIASLTRLVEQAAEQDDAVAKAILLDSAAELAKAVKATVDGLGFKGEIPAALGGGVLIHIDLVRDELLRLCAQNGILLAPVELVTQPVYGAVRMALAALKT